jgi:hypothetical protein
MLNKKDVTFYRKVVFNGKDYEPEKYMEFD